MRIQDDGLEAAAKSIRGIRVEVGRALPVTHKKAGVILVRELQEQVTGAGTASKVGVRTGQFRRRFRHETIPGGVYAFNDSPQTGILNWGGRTRPHVIRPRVAKALRFMVGGAVVFARMVNHPGSKFEPRPFLEPAFRAAIPRLKKLYAGDVASAFRRTIRKKAGGTRG